MGSIDIINPLSTVLSSAFNNSQQHQEINSCECRESNMGPLGATREHHPLCYAVLLRQCLIHPGCFLSVNLFIKKAFMKSRNHFGTPMPLHLNIIDLKVKILHDPGSFIHSMKRHVAPLSNIWFNKYQMHTDFIHSMNRQVIPLYKVWLNKYSLAYQMHLDSL